MVFLSSFSINSFAIEKDNSSSWKVWKSNHKQSVSYRKSIEKPLIEIRAKARLQSSITGFLLFIQETKNIPNWLDNAEYSIVVKQLSKQENLFITKFYSFWPIEARDMAVRSRYWQNDDLSVEISVKDAGADVDLTNNTIRMEVKHAHWRITPITNKAKPTIDIEYIFTVDTKGSIPRWLSKRAALSGIWTTLKNLQKQLPSSIWQDKKLSTIKEPNYSQNQ